ncbi:MAG: peptidyl-alpha-hydroxyglycine alpha-amidating lyase family protein [Candidatus Bathyarchaeia archaeon]
MSMIWQRVDGPSREVQDTRVSDAETLLGVRAWEVKDSPTNLGYRAVEGWPMMPNGWRLGQVAGVAVDTEGRYYVYQRGGEAPPLICFNHEGEYLNSWGEELYVRPHMAKCDEEDNIWLIDDGGHALYLHSPEGELLRRIGTPGVPGEDGCHFNRPTDIAFSTRGGFYISDGYGNKRVAHFDEDLKFISQWGSEGVEEGEFVLPHAITTDDEGLVYVADRNRWRIQIFSPRGQFLRQWTHIGKPFGIVHSDGCLWICDGTNARVTKVDRDGKVKGFFSNKGDGKDNLSTAHDLAIASNGDIITAHLDGRAQLFTHS